MCSKRFLRNTPPFISYKHTPPFIAQPPKCKSGCRIIIDEEKVAKERQGKTEKKKMLLVTNSTAAPDKQ